MGARWAIVGVVLLGCAQAGLVPLRVFRSVWGDFFSGTSLVLTRGSPGVEPITYEAVGLKNGVNILWETSFSNPANPRYFYLPVTSANRNTLAVFSGEGVCQKLPMNVTGKGESEFAAGSFMAVGFYDLLSGQLTQNLKAKDLCGVTGISLSPNGKLLATTTDSGYFQIWDLINENRLLSVFETEGSWRVSRITFSPDDTLVAVCSYKLGIYRVEDGQLSLTPQHLNKRGGFDSGVYCIHVPPVFSTDGQLLVVADGYNPAVVIDVQTGLVKHKLLRRVDPSIGARGPIGVALNSRDEVAVADVGGGLTIYNTEGKVLASKIDEVYFRVLANPSSDLFVTVSRPHSGGEVSTTIWGLTPDK